MQVKNAFMNAPAGWCRTRIAHSACRSASAGGEEHPANDGRGDVEPVEHRTAADAVAANRPRRRGVWIMSKVIRVPGRGSLSHHDALAPADFPFSNPGRHQPILARFRRTKVTSTVMPTFRPTLHSVRGLRGGRSRHPSRARHLTGVESRTWRTHTRSHADVDETRRAALPAATRPASDGIALTMRDPLSHRTIHLH